MAKGTKRRRRSYREQLAIARARLSTIRQVLASIPLREEAPPVSVIGTLGPDGHARFIQCWAASRAGFVVTQALDTWGQVWERRVKLGPEVAKGEERELVDQWWEKVGMDRR